MTTIRITALALGLAMAGCAAPEMPVESRIAVVPHDARFDISVPMSHVVLQVPRGDLQVAPASGQGAAGSPRYFILKGASGLVISGWIEPARLYKPLDETLGQEFAGMAKDGVAKPVNVAKSRVGAFDVFTFDMPLNQSVAAADVRASWHDEDTWIDLHLSCTGSAATIAQLRTQVLDALRGLSVQAKS